VVTKCPLKRSKLVHSVNNFEAGSKYFFWGGA